MSMIPDALLNAYRGTRYTVETSPVGPIVLRVAEHSPRVDRLCQRLGRQSWVYVTACNPRSQVLAPAVNAARMQQLSRVLEARGLPFFPGAGLGEDPAWEPERSVLAVGVDRALALELGQQFEQYAVVYGELGEPAQLLTVPLGQSGDP